MVVRGPRTAPPAHPRGRAALVRGAGAAVPAGAAAPVADRAVPHRDRGGATVTKPVLPNELVLSVVVPAFNEAETIEAVLRRLRQGPPRRGGVAGGGASDRRARG